MISTVTTSTVTTVATAAFAASLSLVAVLTLLIVLIQKEVLSASSGEIPQALSKALNIAVVPLFLSFLFILVVMVAGVLG